MGLNEKFYPQPRNPKIDGFSPAISETAVAREYASTIRLALRTSVRLHVPSWRFPVVGRSSTRLELGLSVFFSGDARDASCFGLEYPIVALKQPGGCTCRLPKAELRAESLVVLGFQKADTSMKRALVKGYPDF